MCATAQLRNHTNIRVFLGLMGHIQGMPNLSLLVCLEVIDFGEDVLLLLVVLVTGGKQSQLLVRLTWTGMDLDWSLTK